DKYGIKNVRAEIVGIETIELKQIYGNETYGIFESKWFVHNVEVGKAYTARIIAENIKGKVSYFDVEFYDDPIFCCRRQINISNWTQNIGVLLNTAFLISQGKMRSDCGDIRFTDSRSFDAAFWTRNFSYNLTCNRFLSGWQYRIPITINNPGPSLTNYSVLVNLPTQDLVTYSVYELPITINNPS
ncbi:MAG: hypothetical protein N3D78_03265, partial [Candidatus Aenigmarchaeota archaeon]|nr:hypothetical protein [Candidatus Aenigmarchaeota archaeon]